MADIREHTLESELERYIGQIISVLQQGGENGRDFVHVRLDYLCTIVVRYVDVLPFGRDLLRLIQSAREIICLQEYTRPVYYDVAAHSNGNRGRPRCQITREQIEFFLDQNFTSSEIASLLGVSERTVKRRVLEFGSSVRARYSDLTEEQLDRIVLRSLDDFPNSGYRRMTGVLLTAGHRVQQQRVRESMRRVDPNGVFLRAIEIRTVRRRMYQVPGPLALWHIDGNHKLIR